jgi:HEAT repeat protein
LEQGLVDPLFLIRLAAAQALGKTQDPKAAKALRLALSDRAMVVRSAVVDSLAELKDRDAIPLLRAELSAERSFYRGRGLWIREHIVDALAVIGGAEAVDAIVSLLKDEDPLILQRSCAALSKLAPEAPPAKEEDLSPGACAQQWLAWHESNKPKPTQ